VLSCTTQLPIKFFRFEGGANILINEGIKCGDYVNVQLQIKAHPAVGQGKAGMYVNPSAVQFLGYGTEIINAPSGDQIFGAAAPTVPPGASAVPLAPNPGQLLQPAGGMPAPAAAPPMPPGMSAAPQPHAPVAPSYQPPVQAPAT